MVLHKVMVMVMFKKIKMLVLVFVALALLVINSAFILGAGVNDYRPGWFRDWEGVYGEEGTQTGVAGNFWLSLNPFLDKYDVSPYANADVYGWYNKSFFSLANWEREVCLIDLSSDVRYVRNVVDDIVLDETNIYTTTLTVSATKQQGFNNSWLYEVSWYVMPYDEDLYYRVYLKKGDDKEYYAGKKGDDDEDFELVSQYVGASGYEAEYLDKVYDEVVLEYKDYGSDKVEEMVVSVVEKEVP